MFGRRQLRQGFLSARTSPATLGTPQCSDIASYAGDSLDGRILLRLIGCYQAAPCCSDQGANLGQHVWGLDTRMSDDVGKLLDFSLTLLQDLFFIFQQARGLSGHTSPCGECALSSTF